MGKLKRFGWILWGLLTLLFSVLLILYPNEGYIIAVAILGLTATISGIRQLFYYFTMARHMVGGKSVLFTGIILMDLGVFTSTLTDVPKIYLSLYLLGLYAFSGGIDIMRALEARRFESPSWRFSLVSGIINIVLAVLALIAGVFLRSQNLLVYIFCLGMIYSSCARIVTAFRKTAVVYIQ